jgi:pilus assembly protein CpaE
MTSSARILLVSATQIEERFRAALPELNGNLRRWSSSPEELYVHRQLGDLVASGAEIVAFGPELPVDSALEMAAELDRLNPEIEVMVMADPTPRVWERAARAGVREVVATTASGEELALAVRRTMATVAGRRGQAKPAQPAESLQRGLIVVRSPKGGSGKTMVASNVAVTLAKQHPGEVVLVDLDLQFGDMSSALGIEPHYTIADATANADLTPTALKTLLSTHKSSLYALFAPPRPEEADVITGDDVAAVLTLLQAAFRYVVVDTAAGTDERVAGALTKASDVVLVCSMDVSSVRAIRKDLESLGAAALSRSRQHVVLNRADSKVALEIKDIEATIGRPVDLHIGSSRLVPLHMNCGVPVVEAEPTSSVARQLGELVQRIAPLPRVAKHPRRRR